MTTEELKSVFKQRFGNEGVVYTSPGRINLIGEHTDYKVVLLDTVVKHELASSVVCHSRNKVL
ncbi:MAG: hypothetical protein IJK78_01760 [Bacteroidales bacterium]|nr:hypothetical protein [Bacteroidales bacterium]